MPEYFRDQLYCEYFSYRICDILFCYSTHDRNKFRILCSMCIFRLLLNSINIIVFRYNFHTFNIQISYDKHPNSFPNHCTYQLQQNANICRVFHRQEFEIQHRVEQTFRANDLLYLPSNETIGRRARSIGNFHEYSSFQWYLFSHG